MACLFTEGFDKYGIPTVTAARLNVLMANEWTTPSANSIVAPLSSAGQACRFAGGTGVNLKTLAASYSRLIGGMRFASNLAASAVGVYFADAGTTQVSISINTSGFIVLRSGTFAGGAVIATSVASVAADSIHYLEWDLTFADAGAYNVWLDGVNILTGNGDMKQSANATANQLGIGSLNSSGDITIDDLYLFDTSGALCNAVLNTNPVVETQFPTSDDTSDFAMVAGFIGLSESTGGSSSAPGVRVYLRKITPAVNMTLNSVSQMPAATSAGAKFKAVLYSDTAGAPDALIATGTETVGTVSGTAFNAPFGAGQALTGGTSYWIGYITDTSVSIASGHSTLDGQSKLNTYASGAPATLSGMTTGLVGWQIWGNVTAVAVNYPIVANTPPGPADASYVSSSTVGNEDLFGFPALSFTPAAIYAVGVKAWARDTDAGLRTVTMQMKSGGTDTAGAAATPAASYGWLNAYYHTDPNTALAWTFAGVNAAVSGYKIAS